MFHYSSLNFDLAMSTPSGSINILWNQLGEKSKANSIMYMTPNFDPSIGYTYPEFGVWGNNLLNPMLAIQQTMQSFQNGNWMNGINGGNWFNNMPWNNWNNPWGGGNNSGSTAGNAEYDALKALINKYKEIGTKNNTISPALLDKINAALNKSGKPEEKLEALKDLYKSLDKTKLEKALLELPEYKIMLDEAGYNFNGTNKEYDTKLKKELNSLEQDIKSGKGDLLAQISASENNAQILRIVSYWNDNHSAKENRGIIRLVAQHIPAEESERTLHIEGVKNLSMSLINKVEDFKGSVDGNFTNLDKATEELSKALTNATKAPKEFTKANLEALADKFDKLYAMLRMMEAERIRNTINTKYSFLNDISSSDRDIVNDDLVLKSTKEDLRKEGISLAGVETDNVPTEEVEEVSDIDEVSETAEEKVEKLVEKENLKQTEKEGVFQSVVTSSNEPAHFYTIKDDKLVELKDVKSIDKDGKCTMADGTTKTLEQVKADAVEVSAQDIIDYNNTLTRVDELVKDGTISKVDTSAMGAWPKNVKLYKSKGIQENGKPQYFIVKDNKLMKINCTGINPGGTIVVDGSALHLKNLTNEYFSTISDSDIVTEDEQKKAEERKKEEAKTQKEEEERKLKEKYEKKFEVHEVDGADQIGKDIATDLMGITDKDEWDTAVDNINKIDKENVYSVIKAYAAKEGWGTDNILEQIATEYGREKEQQKKLINHIIKAVLEYCEQYGSNSPSAYKELEKYKNGITDEVFNSPEDKLRAVDRLILRVFGIRN